MFGRYDIDESGTEGAEVIGVFYVFVQRCGVELCQYVNASDIRIQAVGYGDIHQPVFACDGDCGFASGCGEWI
jgi:hypothetical protein